MKQQGLVMDEGITMQNTSDESLKVKKSYGDKKYIDGRFTLANGVRGWMTMER